MFGIGAIAYIIKNGGDRQGNVCAKQYVQSPY